jgi:hypothetical protein
MKKTVLAILLCLLTLGAWAEEWSHKGNKWSTSTVEISVSSSLKVTQDSNGLLTLDNENLRVILTPLPSGLDFAAVEKLYVDALDKEFKGLTWGQPTTSQLGEANIQSRDGHTSMDGVAMHVKLSLLSKESQRLSVMSVQIGGDKAAAALADQILSSARFK